MAPHTAGGLASGMARSGHIHCENYGFIGTNRPVPAPAFSHSLDLYLENLGPVAHGRHTLRTALGGCILEYAYPEGPIPSLVAGCGQIYSPRNQRATAHDKLTQGMAWTNHILLGNHMVNHTKGPALASALGHGPNLHLRNLGPAAYGSALSKLPTWGTS
jgi:hypothetical protein